MKFHFNSTWDSKDHDVTDFEICEFHRNTKIYLSRERNITFSSNKKLINYTSRATLWQKIVL